MSVNDYAYGVGNPTVDGMVQKTFPAVTLAGTEINGGVSQVVEVGGATWIVSNAMYNALFGGFQQQNALAQSAALVISPTGIVQLATAPAGSPVPIIWAYSSFNTISLTVFNVKTYGALGNGVADDTDAINAAITAAIAAGGGEVFFPAGVYLIGAGVTTNLKLGSNITLQGASQGAVTLRLHNPGTNTGGIIYDTPPTGTAYSNIWIQDITFDLNGTTTVNTAISFTSTGYNNVHVVRCKFIGNNGGHQTIAFGAVVGTTTASSFTIPAIGASGPLVATSAAGVTVGSIARVQNGVNDYLGLVTSISGTTLTVTTLSLGTNASPIAGGANVFFLSSNCSVENCLFYYNASASYGDLEVYSHLGFAARNNTFEGHSAGSTAATLYFYGYNLLFSAQGNTFKNNTQTDILVQQGCGGLLTGNIHIMAANIACCTLVNVLDVTYSSNRVLGTQNASLGSSLCFLYDYAAATFDGTHTNIYPNSNRIAIADNDAESLYFGVELPAATDASKNQAMTNITIENNRFSDILQSLVFINGNGTVAATGIAFVRIKGNVLHSPLGVGTHGAFNIVGASGVATAISDIYITENELPSGTGNALVVTNPVTRLYFDRNEVVGVTTPIRLVTSGNVTRAIGNPGYNPVGFAASPPAFPATTVAQANTYPQDAMVYVTAGASAVTLAVSGGSGGTAANVVVPASACVGVLVPFGATITPTYASGAPTWAWSLN